MFFNEFKLFNFKKLLKKCTAYFINSNSYYFDYINKYFVFLLLKTS